MKKLKTGALATLIACAMAACLGLVACSSGPTDEEVIKEGIASELDPIKNLDDATLDGIRHARVDGHRQQDAREVVPRRL